jgi:hypothetical protein
MSTVNVKAHHLNSHALTPSAGPCLSTHTACSSSLVSTHLAHTALLNSECTHALSSGIFMILLAGTMAGISQLQVGGGCGCGIKADALPSCGL